MWAAFKGRKGVAALLLQNGADIDAKDKVRGDGEGLCIANRVIGGEGLAQSLGFEGDRMRVGWG